jgi:hypothetical protein
MFKAFLFNVTNSYFKFLFIFFKKLLFHSFQQKKIKKEFPLLALINMYICKQI